MNNIELLPNKILSILLLIIGFIVCLFDGDGTVLFFLSIISIPMLFAKENWTIFQITSEEIEDEQRPKKECLRLPGSNGIRSNPKHDERERNRTPEQAAVDNPVHI